MELKPATQAGRAPIKKNTHRLWIGLAVFVGLAAMVGMLDHSKGSSLSSSPTVPQISESEKQQKAAADRRDFVSGMQRAASERDSPELWLSKGGLDTTLVIQSLNYTDAGTVKRTMRAIQIKLLPDLCQHGFTDVELAAPGMATPVTRIPLQCWQAGLSESARKVLRENK